MKQCIDFHLLKHNNVTPFACLFRVAIQFARAVRCSVVCKVILVRRSCSRRTAAPLPNMSSDIINNEEDTTTASFLASIAEVRQRREQQDMERIKALEDDIAARRKRREGMVARLALCDLKFPANQNTR